MELGIITRENSSEKEALPSATNLSVMKQRPYLRANLFKKHLSLKQGQNKSSCPRSGYTKASDTHMSASFNTSLRTVKTSTFYLKYAQTLLSTI